MTIAFVTSVGTIIGRQRRSSPRLFWEIGTGFVPRIYQVGDGPTRVSRVFLWMRSFEFSDERSPSDVCGLDDRVAVFEDAFESRFWRDTATRLRLATEGMTASICEGTLY